MNAATFVLARQHCPRKRNTIVFAECDALRDSRGRPRRILNFVTRQFRGIDRRSDSFESSVALVQARSDKLPIAFAWIRHAMRLINQTRFPVLVSSPKTSAYFLFSSFTDMRSSNASSRWTLTVIQSLLKESQNVVNHSGRH